MSLDKKLTLATLATFFALGTVSLYGIFDYAEKSGEIKGFAASPDYSNYIHKMNSLAFPSVVALLLLLSLCILKRILPERRMLSLIFLMLGIALLSSTKGLRFSLGTVLSIALLIQLAVLSLALGGRRLRFMEASYCRRVGSSMFHLGIVAIALSVVEPAWLYFEHLEVFWFSTGLVALGMALMFFLPNFKIRKGVESFG